MKFVPINMDYSRFQFNALKRFLGVRLFFVKDTSLPNCNFFIVNSQFWEQNCKFRLSNCLDTNFHNISNIGLRVIRRRNYN